MNPLVQEILLLIGVAAKEVEALVTTGTAHDVAKVSDDMLAAINAVLQRHAANQGVPIDQVLAQL